MAKTKAKTKKKQIKKVLKKTVTTKKSLKKEVTKKTKKNVTKKAEITPLKKQLQNIIKRKRAKKKGFLIADIKYFKNFIMMATAIFRPNKLSKHFLNSKKISFLESIFSPTKNTFVF